MISLFRLRHLLAASAALLAFSAVHGAEPMVKDRPLSSVATAKIAASADTYWAGQVFTFTRETRIATSHFSSIASEFEWTPPGIVLEDWSPATRSSGGGFETLTSRTRAYVRGTGTVALPGTTQAVKLITGYAGDRSALTDPFTVPVAAPRLTVRPLPTPTPSGFAKAVGEFTLQASISTTQARIGESVTWTVELAGTGNWPEISRLPGRVVSKDFNAVAPVVKRTIEPGTLFKGSLREDVLLVPTKAGEYQFGPIRYTYFDPNLGRYQMVTSETFTLVVSGAAGARPADTSAERYRPVNAARTPIPANPQPLPLDPLGPGWSSLKPFHPSTQTVVTFVVLLAVAAYWLTLAAQRSQRTDPLYARRQARARLGEILRELDRQSHTAEELRRLLFAWQEATIAFAGLKLVTPSAAQIAHAIEGRGTAGSSWAPLWREANAALYGAHGLLVPDWIMRAKAALSEQTIRPVPVSALFLRRNLLPFAGTAAAITLALLACAFPSDAHAEDVVDGTRLYQKGDFAAAETEWRKTVAAHPLDAHAHYNLALAAAQQDRWPESVARSLAAFCLEPANPAIRWQLALSLDRAGIDNPALNGFVAGESPLRFRIARTFSPGQWGLAHAAAAAFAGLAVATLLFGTYRGRSRLFRWSAAVCTALGLAGIGAANTSLECYGLLADESIAVVSRNILLCSVPSEIDTAQKTVPLPAGSLAKVDRTFLGWSRLVFPNQQTGWVRSDALVALYR